MSPGTFDKFFFAFGPAILVCFWLGPAINRIAGLLVDIQVDLARLKGIEESVAALPHMETTLENIAYEERL